MTTDLKFAELSFTDCWEKLLKNNLCVKTRRIKKKKYWRLKTELLCSRKKWNYFISNNRGMISQKMKSRPSQNMLGNISISNFEVIQLEGSDTHTRTHSAYVCTDTTRECTLIYFILYIFNYRNPYMCTVIEWYQRRSKY